MSAVQQNTESLNKLDFIRLGKPIRLKYMRAVTPQETKKSQLASEHKAINKKRQTSLMPRQAPTNRKITQAEQGTRNLNKKTVEAVVLDENKATMSLNVESMISNEEMNRLEQSKNISSMISENFTLSNTIQSCHFFNSLPISPSTMCHSYAATSFFNPNEMNVTNMLTVSNVEGLFCDDL
jgi:hypothetical protein